MVRRVEEPDAVQHESGMWEDRFGAHGPLKPGTGPRQDPDGWFPTGPDVGEVLPDIALMGHLGETVDVHALRNGGPAVVVFHRSAVW